MKPLPIPIISPPQHNGKRNHRRVASPQKQTLFPPPLFLLAHAFPIGDLTNVSGSTIKSNGAAQHCSLLVQKIRAAAATDPCGEEGDCRLWRWWGSWLHCMGKEGERRISCPHHKKSRNLMSNFAQHRVVEAAYSSFPLLSPTHSVESQKIKVSSSCVYCEQKGGEGEREREREKERFILFRDKLCPSGAAALRQYPATIRPPNHQDGRRAGAMRHAIIIRYPPLKCCICFLFSQIRLFARSFEGLPPSPSASVHEYLFCRSVGRASRNTISPFLSRSHSAIALPPDPHMVPHSHGSTA